MQKKALLNILFCSIIITIFSSCVSQTKIAYFQKSPDQSDTIDIAKAYVPKIQAGDILSIYINSLNSAASSFFNPYSSTSIGSEANTGIAGSSAIAQSNAPGFLVDQSGIIELPLVGEIKVAGLTTSQARDTIKAHLNAYLKEPTVNVRFLNYKISIMGEVMHPSDYTIATEKITLPEAISLAGDLTIFGKRDNILIVRNYNGKKEFGRVDLNTRDVFTSPYYYLNSGDLIYVEPSNVKKLQVDPVVRILPIVLSSIALIVTLFLRLK